MQWEMVQLTLIIEVLLGLKSKQGDVAAKFNHSDISNDEKV